MFRRRLGRGGFRRDGKPQVHPLLKRANQSLIAGQFVEAAEAFEQIAEAALARQGPRAPLFFLQAGRARILNGQSAPGIEHLQHGLRLFAEQGNTQRVHHAGRRVLAELKERGLSSEAEQMQNFINTLLPQGFTAPHEESLSQSKRTVLPTHCAACGAVVKPNEVEWLDDVTAECEYCGSPVRGG